MAKKKEEMGVPAIVDSVETLEAKMKAMREAQKEFAKFSQEQVDKIFYEAAMAANKMRIPLAKMAVEETQRGVLEDKIIKNHYAAEYIYNAYKDTKTCGVIEEDTAYGIKKVAEPIGLVAAVIPTTNPTSTAIFKTLICLKTRNAIIISPHPSAKACTIEAAKVVLDAAVKAGAPEGIIGWIDVPSLELTNQVMRDSDIILATGGPGMVKAAYSSGKPALGVGPGNTPVIIDDTADIKMAVNSIIHSKTFDNGMICASEQSVTVLDSIYEEVKKEFQYRGCYFLKKGAELDKVRKTIIINGALNSKIPGKSAYEIAKMSGIPDINVDLIAALPGETPASALCGTRRITDLAPRNITVHSFSVKKSAELRSKNTYDSVGEQAKISLSGMHSAIADAGYLPYYMYRQKNTVGNLENVGFSLPGSECMYNIFMMEEVHTIFAAGASSVTKFVRYSPDGRLSDIKRIFEPKYPYEYLREHSPEKLGERRKAFSAAADEFFGKE